MQVRRWDGERDGEPTEAAVRQALERLGYAVARYDYPPGTRFPTHTHAIEKMDAVVRGRLRITTEEGSVVLEAGDAVQIPRGAPHSAEVVGSETVVSLDGTKG